MLLNNTIGSINKKESGNVVLRHISGFHCRCSLFMESLDGFASSVVFTVSESLWLRL